MIIYYLPIPTLYVQEPEKSIERLPFLIQVIKFINQLPITIPKQTSSLKHLHVPKNTVQRGAVGNRADIFSDAQGNAGPDNIHTIWAGTGTVQTLDESPPEFTTLTVKDAGGGCGWVEKS